MPALVPKLLSTVFTFGFVRLEVAEFALFDRDDFCEIPRRRAVTLNLLKELGENVIVLRAFKILGDQARPFSLGLCLDALDVSGFSVAGVTAQDDQLGLRVKDGGCQTPCADGCRRKSSLIKFFKLRIASVPRQYAASRALKARS